MRAGPQSAFFSTRDAHADEAELPVPFDGAAFGVGEEGIAAVDDDIIRIDELGKLGQHRIDRRAGFHHDDDAARFREGFDERGDRFRPDDIEPNGAVRQEILQARPGARL
ncbi:MAG: hypothetical protein R2848_17640 [Thermomicrobiales bacterium]